MIDAQSAVAERKVCVEGTHRARRPDETLRWIRPVFAEVGITRLADVTWLDEIGIPVCQAVRPDSYSLSVSQGKGLTVELAMVSAAMESIELWHAERMPAGERVAPPGEMTDEIGYRVEELALASRSAVHNDGKLAWSRARGVCTATPTWLPTELVALDGRIKNRWRLPLFERSSNGLASGNTLREALLHGLYEVIERDALARAGAGESTTPLALETVDGPAADLIERMRRADVDVWVSALPSPLGLPCFQAGIWSDNLPLVFTGSGCHADRDVALCRALTEAAQSRVTVIAGARDDIKGADYTRAEVLARLQPPNLAELSRNGRRLAYSEMDTVRQPDLAEDLRDVTDRVIAVAGREPLYVDHTRPGLNVPVVHVVCPGLRFDPMHV